jgi:hypothetical protein
MEGIPPKCVLCICVSPPAAVSKIEEAAGLMRADEGERP